MTPDDVLALAAVLAAWLYALRLRHADKAAERAHQRAMEKLANGGQRS